MTSTIKVDDTTELSVLEKRDAFAVENSDWKRLKKKIGQIKQVSQVLQNAAWVAAGLIPTSLINSFVIKDDPRAYWFSIIFLVLSLTL